MWFATGLLLFLIIFIDAHFRKEVNLPLIHRRANMAGALQLTDLCLFTEARYTRHISQADIHSAFQDNPVSIEHFPAGSLALPPEYLRNSHEKND